MYWRNTLRLNQKCRDATPRVSKNKIDAKYRVSTKKTIGFE